MIKKYEKRNNKIVSFVSDDYFLDDSKVIVDVLYCGICGTDYQKYIGMDNVHEWGHEIIGRVKNDGSLVTIRTTYPCNECLNCQNGHSEKCMNWERLNFVGFSNQILVNPKSIINIYEEKVDIVYALVEPLYVANSLIKHVMPNKDSVYTVVGNGTIGLLSAFLIRKIYGSEVRIVGRRNFHNRCRFIKNIGVNYYDFDDIENALSGSDKIIITTPYNTVPDIVKLVDSHSNVTFNGISKETKVLMELDKWHFKNISIWPSFPHPQSDFSFELNMIKENKDLLRSIITNVYSLDEIEAAFECLRDKNNDCIKILLKCKEE